MLERGAGLHKKYLRILGLYRICYRIQVEILNEIKSQNVRKEYTKHQMCMEYKPSLINTNEASRLEAAI